jgi:hypothetical protein
VEVRNLSIIGNLTDAVSKALPVEVPPMASTVPSLSRVAEGVRQNMRPQDCTRDWNVLGKKFGSSETATLACATWFDVRGTKASSMFRHVE